jgi:hypothetical protein
VYGPTTHALSLKIAAPGACRLTPTTVGRSARAAGSCTVARLPKGSKATLQYRFKGKWIVLASGKSRGGGLHFTVRFAVPGKYAIQLILSASSVYTRTVINVPSLRVR